MTDRVGVTAVRSDESNRRSSLGVYRLDRLRKAWETHSAQRTLLTYTVRCICFFTFRRRFEMQVKALTSGRSDWTTLSTFNLLFTNKFPAADPSPAAADGLAISADQPARLHYNLPQPGGTINLFHNPLTVTVTSALSRISYSPLWKCPQGDLQQSASANDFSNLIPRRFHLARTANQRQITGGGSASVIERDPHPPEVKGKRYYLIEKLIFVKYHPIRIGAMTSAPLERHLSNALETGTVGVGGRPCLRERFPAPRGRERDGSGGDSGGGSRQGRILRTGRGIAGFPANHGSPIDSSITDTDPIRLGRSSREGGLLTSVGFH
ncbi:hypothetical protein Bbelb_183320 [Branchiostoma belcheri]|nr:hypothetical protein Bbelb_183320 [Branchiostoma belcheri]